MIPCTSSDLVIHRWGARFMGRRFACAIGQGGIGTKQREGDGVTPIGCFNIIGGAYRSDRCAPTPALDLFKPIGPRDIWCDDPADPRYNQPYRCFNYRYSHEKLRRNDPIYDIVGFLDYNWPNAIAGRGSAIFLHIWRAPRMPTQGCIAFNRADLLWILSRFGAKSRVIVRG